MYWKIHSLYTGTVSSTVYLHTKRRLNSGNACCHSIKNLLSSHLLSKNLKIKIYKTIILPVVLYECETFSLALREEHIRLRVFDNRMLRRIFGPKKDEETGGGENCITKGSRFVLYAEYN
jgi:hypothetical protein